METQNKKNSISQWVLDKFLSQGDISFSMDTLASSMKISKKTIYRNFPSRDALIDYALDCFFNILDGKFEKTANTDFNSPGELRELIRKWFSILTDVLSRFNISRLNSVRFSHPLLWEKVNNKREHIIRKNLGTMLRKAKDKGFLKDEIPVDLALDAFLGIISSTANPETMIRYGGTDVFISFISTFFLEGIIQQGDKNEH